MLHYGAAILVILTIAPSIESSTSDWNNPSSNQYHIQTDEGPERYFRYQTTSGQYRKEKRLEDGSVVGTYAWIDDDGFLRQRDYIADDGGYRILKTKNVYVGRNTPINIAIKSAKKAPASAGTLVKSNAPKPTTSPVPSVTPYVEIRQNSIPSSTPVPYQYSTTPAPNYSTSSLRKSSDLSNLFLPANTVSLDPQRTSFVPNPTTPAPSYGADPWYYSGDPQYERPRGEPLPLTFQNGPTYPIDKRGQTYTGNNLGNGYDPQYDYYDGVSVTNDGFRYYIPKAYHEEQNLPNDKKSGSFGYIDPFGIRRVIYYNAGPGTGFQHRKNNRYVGFDATPYDPRPY